MALNEVERGSIAAGRGSSRNRSNGEPGTEVLWKGRKTLENIAEFLEILEKMRRGRFHISGAQAAEIWVKVRHLLSYGLFRQRDPCLMLSSPVTSRYPFPLSILPLFSSMILEAPSQ